MSEAGSKRYRNGASEVDRPIDKLYPLTEAVDC